MAKFSHFWFWFTLGGLAAGCATNPKHPITVTAPARLEHRDTWTYLTISDGVRHYEMPWAMPPHYTGIVPLEADRVYTLTIVNERFRGFPLSQVVRVEQDGRTIYDREVCEVHHQTMERKKVRIIYGLVRPGPDAPSDDTERSSFPHHREVSFGGCASGPGSPKSDRVFVCSECKVAYAEWRAQNSGIR